MMFMPPPASDEPHSFEEPEPEPVVTLSTWRHRGKWPALMRLSWLFKLFAVLSLVVGAISAVVIGLQMGGTPAARFAALLWSLGTILSAIIAYFVWLGLSELILLLIAIERSTRQTRDRVGKHLHEEPRGSRG